MALVRAYQPTGRPVRIVIPNEKLRMPGESNAEFLARICAHTEAMSELAARENGKPDLSLKGLPFADMDQAVLPTERTRPDAQGRPLDVRRAWRLVGVRIVVSEPDV